MTRTPLAWAVAAIICAVLWGVLPRGSAGGPAPPVVGITLQSAFTSGRVIPAAWVEVLIFAKDPAGVEFFESPRRRLVNEQNYVVEIHALDFPEQKLWLLYRFDESAAEQARSADADRRRFYEAHRDAAWVFEVPAAADLGEVTIDGANLTYTLKSSGARRTIAGAAFGAPLPRYGGARKGAQGYVRIDHLREVDFAAEATEFNRTARANVRLDAGNGSVWPGQAALYVAPASLGGQRYVGPREQDRAAVERGYTPVFFVLGSLPGDLALPQDRPWAAVDRAAGELITDLPRQDPELWATLSPQVQARYRVPARIAAGGETRLIVLWKREADLSARFFALFIRRPGGEEFRAVLFRLVAASAR
jgi:hypothetical protein